MASDTRHNRSFTVDVPAGIERVLYLAATEVDFREQLMRERARAAEDRGLQLRDSERAVLQHAPAAQLEGLIDSLDTTARNVQRRTFLQAVAASTAGLATAGAVGCSDDDDKDQGKLDSVPLKQDSTAGSRGIRIDAGPDLGGTAGILPDGPAPKKDTLPVDAPMMGPESAGIKPG